MAMLAFCGYNMADYWAHWLSMEKRASHLPKVFRVNWFRRDERGRFLWPGFGENVRVLKWVIERCRGDGEAEETPIGHVPTPSAIGGKGLDVSEDVLEELLRVDREAWRTNLRNQAEFFAKFEDRLPTGIREEHEALARRLKMK
jgi:phosphoenolpyruvate carboxykinase (GTP)